MKIDLLKPWQTQAIIGGDGPPSCWDNPDDDDNDWPTHGGPTIFFPGFPGQ